MPQAVTHILVPILIMAIIRDFFIKNKKSFSLHYVLLAGLGGVLPDIDLVFSVILKYLGAVDWNIHKTFSHSLFFPLIFFALFLVLLPVHSKAKICNLGRHKLKLSTICLMLSFGITTHIILDALSGGDAYLFYPLSLINFRLNLIDYLSRDIASFIFPLIDGILLVIWIMYLELKHKISDFI